MNVNLKVLGVGALFFLGGGVVLAQKKDTATKTKDIEEVVVQGIRTVSKKTAIGAVQSIKSETLESRPQANVMNAVQGQLAGVNIATGSGQPGAKPTVIIRGVGTLSGTTDPLYVIDGFPTNADAFRTLNSYDIESMEVLKDPSALAEYGNRASNGVVVIRTKRGAIGRGRLDVRYSTQLGVTMLQNNKYNLATGSQLLALEKAYGAGVGASMTDEEIGAYGKGTNWMDYFFRPSMLTSHNLSVENSGKSHSAYTSVGYMEQDGMLRGTSLKRFTVRNNVSGRSDNNKFKYYLGLSAGFTRNSDQSAVGTGGVNQNPVLGALKGVSYFSPDMYQGTDWLLAAYRSSGSMAYSPLMLIDRLRTSSRDFNETRLEANSELSYLLLPGFTAKLKVNAGANSQRIVTGVRNPNSFNSLLFSPTRFVKPENGGAYNGVESISENMDFQYNNMLQLDYRKSFGKHTFNVNGAFDYNFSQFTSDGFTQTGLNPKTYVPGAGTGYVRDTAANDWYSAVSSASQLRLNLVSYIGSFDYDFNKKYGVVASIRRDGTSRFIGDYKWGTFWSVGGRWNLEEENFIKNLGFVNALKLRGSYGTVGNQRIVSGSWYEGLLPPAFADVYEVANNVYNNSLGYAINFGDPDLRWETTASYNVGLDFEFFNRRLRGSFDVYEKKTEDMFYSDPTSPLFGATSVTKNTEIGLYNRGYELSLAYDVLKKSDLGLTFRANGSINNQEVFGITQNDGIIQTGSTNIVRIQNGHRPFLPYLFEYIGVSDTGNLLFRGADGLPTENPTEADRKLAKYNHLPKYQGGFGLDFNYGGFFTSATFTFVAGINRFDWDLSSISDPTDLGQFNVSADLLNAWTPTNTNTDVPSLTASNLAYSESSDRFLVDASYLRLRNLQVGYNIPKQLLENTFLKSMSVSLQAENLVTWTKWRGFDPESNRASDQYQYPSPRIFTLGLDVKF